MAARCPDLPFLPGLTFNPLIGQTRFNKDTKFDFIGQGVQALVEKVKPNILGPLSDRYPSLYARGEVPEIPAWIAYDKQILRFDGFFQETLQEFKEGAPFLIRKVKVLFFLEDGTIQVIEPKTDNSGISQGNVISRQRIRFPPPMDANFYDIVDLNVGNEVEFYRRIYKLTDCDRFTRVFLNRCGIAVPDPVEVPEDPYLKGRALDAEGELPKKPSRKTDTYGQFLKFDGKILKFDGYWDDQETDCGYFHYLEIHYYLADDTIDIKENVVDTSGRKSGFVFIRRTKLPKVYKGLPSPGAFSPFTVLNVLGNDTNKRFIADALDCGREHVDYYTEKDLGIGGVLNVYGRKIVIYDCDQYTKEYYSKKYGLDDFSPAALPPDLQKAPCNVVRERELPPWNGYGSFEDSAQNCITVEPKPPLMDLQKFIKLDRVGMDSHILRYEARMISKIPENCGRIFVISFFLADDTISVFELARRNDGFKTSKFFKRAPINLPGQPTFTSNKPEIYKPQHLFIGATVVINSYRFVLIDADDYALRYMELHDFEYPKSNIVLIMGKVREVLRPIYKDFVAENLPTETPTITYSQLRNKLCRVMGNDFTEQEMVTISRAYSANCVEEQYDREAIRAITLTELKRYLWDDLERTAEYLRKFDTELTGVLSEKEVYTLMKACRIPIDRVLINRIMKVIKKDNNGNLIYQDLINFLDRTKCPLEDTIPVNIKYDLWWGSIREPKAGTLIDWCAFNKALNLEETFADVCGNEHATHH